MKFELPKLPYEMNALEPFISKRTLEFHHGKHHQTYVTNLNNLIVETKYENAKLESIIMEAEGPLLNNAEQVWNHTFYFMGLKNDDERTPKDSPLAEAIDKNFGTMAGFKDAFIKAALSLFGSGWVWLVKKQLGSLEIINEKNAGNPLRKGLSPILTCDVWEHAYYLDYQNRRAEYMEAFWNIINWPELELRYCKDEKYHIIK
jgi:superoxide dismutase, Fe-Mn family